MEYLTIFVGKTNCVYVNYMIFSSSNDVEFDHAFDVGIVSVYSVLLVKLIPPYTKKTF